MECCWYNFGQTFASFLSILSLIDTLRIAFNVFSQRCQNQVHLLIPLKLPSQSDGAAHALSSPSVSERLGCSLCCKAFQSYMCMRPLSTLYICRDPLYSAQGALQECFIPKYDLDTIVRIKEQGQPGPGSLEASSFRLRQAWLQLL